MTRGEIRLKFKENKLLTYSNITASDIHRLKSLLRKELKAHHAAGGLQMKLKRKHYRESSFDINGSLTDCYLRVNSYYFEKREGISFNTAGFIGFAGWADGKNIQPFLKAFDKWIDELTEKLK